MKIQIRKSVFETNSSTCHTLVVPKHDMIWPEDPIERWDIHSWDTEYTFGRGLLTMLNTIGDKIAYAFMLICYDSIHKTRSKESGGEGLEIEDILPDVDKWKNMIEGWIDECGGTPDSIELAKMLLKWLEDMMFYDKSNISEFGGYAWIEHPEEMMYFIEAIKKDPELLKKFIFDKDAYATVCGDEYRGAYLKKVGFEYDYDDDGWYRKKEELETDYYVF